MSETIFIRPEIIRPPSEAGSYFLPFTSGCSNNSCIFCNFYDCHLKIRELSEIIKEIDALGLFLKTGIRIPEIPYIAYAIAREWDGRRIFLQDGDALVYPFEQLKEALTYLNNKFPGLERIASYGTTQDILRLSTAQLQTLKQLKLGILYVGVESGNDEILGYIRKGVTSKQIIEAGKLVKSSGITNSVTVLLGLGGPEKSQIHALDTARVLTDLDPEYVGALTLTLIPGTPIFDDARSGRFKLITPMQSLQELRTIIANASFTNCFLSSMHASNYLSIRGKLPQDKAKMLAQIDYVLNSQDPHLLRPEYLRGL